MYDVLYLVHEYNFVVVIIVEAHIYEQTNTYTHTHTQYKMVCQHRHCIKIK